MVAQDCHSQAILANFAFLCVFRVTVEYSPFLGTKDSNSTPYSTQDLENFFPLCKDYNIFLCETVLP